MLHIGLSPHYALHFCHVCFYLLTLFDLSFAVAGLFGMYTNSNMTFEEARSLLQRLKGIQAIQTVKVSTLQVRTKERILEYKPCGKHTISTKQDLKEAYQLANTIQ